jgi:trimeric autotransporter adhesin
LSTNTYNIPLTAGIKTILITYQTAMRYFSLAIFLFSFSVAAVSQNVGIGVTPPLNRLHVNAPADPLRLDGLQTGATTDSVVTVDATGVLRRRTLAAVTGQGAWSITGNGGLSATTNFLGTTNLIPLVIRTNNQRSGYIDADSSKRNNSFGNRAMPTTVTGSGNNGFGSFALNKLTTGVNNVALGDSAMFSVTTGLNNVAIGSDALFTAVTATGNIAIGLQTLKNTVSSENIAIGNLAANSNTIGSNILAIGAGALQDNQTTFTQLAIGNNALKSVTSGLENLAIGYNAGTTLGTASYNVLLGNYALSSATNSNQNTIVGHNAALAYTGSGNTNNTFVGYQTAFTQTGGTGNTFIGVSIDVAPASSSFSNSTGLGQGVLITASNQVRVGNTSVNSIGGQVGWTTFSDERVKKDIREDIHGLDFIMRLRPVSYNYDPNSLYRLQTGIAKTGMEIDNPNTGVRFSGFLAQEVEQAAIDAQYNFSGVDKPVNANTPYGIRYAEMVVPLVKAMQEMKLLIDKQQAEIEALKKLIK